MKTTTLSAFALATALALAGAAAAQDAPVGGPTAKANAPVKKAHTVNDGAAKPGRNSFTEAQARQHIVNAGYQSVSGLNKGKDGVWRGMAARGDTLMNVALDFKGNVTEAGPATRKAGTAASGAAAGGPGRVGAGDTRASGGGDRSADAASPASSAGARSRAGSSAEAAVAGDGAAGAAAATGSGSATEHSASAAGQHRKRLAAARGRGCSTHPGPNGVACSGVDRNKNGVSDREDLARR